MANLEHIALLKKSTTECNQWREENPRVIPYLILAELEYANLQNANLRGALFYGANLQGTDLTDARELTCEQINSVRVLDKNTKFPDYLGVKVIREHEWICWELQ